MSQISANHSFFDPRAAADIQAIDRVHRIGQNKQVYIFRFMVNNSIDERIYDMQKEKTQMAQLTIGCSTAARHERMKDFKKLLT